jgi:ATP-dependent Lhr-like helicase
LVSEYRLSASNARALVEHFELQASVSRIPTADFFLIERFDQRGLLHYFFHSLIGRSANDALSRIISHRLNAAVGGNALVTIDDYGFLLTVRSFQELGLEEWRELFHAESAARPCAGNGPVDFRMARGNHRPKTRLVVAGGPAFRHGNGLPALQLSG